jgi:hypothetical protein
VKLFRDQRSLTGGRARNFALDELKLCVVGKFDAGAVQDGVFTGSRRTDEQDKMATPHRRHGAGVSVHSSYPYVYVRMMDETAMSISIIIRQSKLA